MRTAALVLLLVVSAVPTGVAKRHATFRVHLEANASDGPAFSTKLRMFGREVTIEKMATISENDVTGVRTYQAADGTNGALFQLNEHGRLTLDSLSVERRGRSLFVFINGRPVTELQIDRRVSDGKIYIASGLTTSEVESLKADWPAQK